MPFITLETEATETPAFKATALIVGIDTIAPSQTVNDYKINGLTVNDYKIMSRTLAVIVYS